MLSSYCARPPDGRFLRYFELALAKLNRHETVKEEWIGTVVWVYKGEKEGGVRTAP